MCGRAAQTQDAVMAAAVTLGASLPDGFVVPDIDNQHQNDNNNNNNNNSNSNNGNRNSNGNRNDMISSKNNASNDNDSPSEPIKTPQDETRNHQSKKQQEQQYPWRNNYNMSPGMDAMVFWMEDGQLCLDRKVWGLVPKRGTTDHPLPSDTKARMALHFSNLMYNARTDTMYEKPTFSRLAHQGKSCLVALDGYFEWKSSPLAGGKGKKQPYFVYRNQNQKNPMDLGGKNQNYLLLPGLWTRVTTGLEDEPTLDTFTIFTTDANQQMAWLHHRMPVCCWDLALAKEWLERPTQKLHAQLDAMARVKSDGLAWHMVTTEMSKVNFRDKVAIQALPKAKTVASFFTAMSSKNSSGVETVLSAPRAGESKPEGPKTVASFLVTRRNSEGYEASEQQNAAASSSGQQIDITTKRKSSRDSKRNFSTLSSDNQRMASTPQNSSPKKKKMAESPTGKGTITSFFQPKTKTE